MRETDDAKIHKISLDHVRAGGGAGIQAEADERGADHLPAHRHDTHHRLPHQLLQGNIMFFSLFDISL